MWLFCSSASIGLLEAKLSKLQTQLSTEQRLEQTLIESLKQAELVTCTKVFDYSTWTQSLVCSGLNLEY